MKKSKRTDAQKKDIEAFREAVMVGDTQKMQALSDRVLNDDKSRMLIQWISKGPLAFDVVQGMIQCGAQVRYNHSEALRLSSKNQSVDVIRFLVEVGGNIHAKYDEILLNSIRKDGDRTVQYLLDLGCIATAHHHRAIKTSIRSGLTAITNLLVRPLIHQQSVMNTVFYESVLVKDHQGVLWALSHGADVQHNNNAALRAAVYRQGKMKVIQSLLDHGADPTSKRHEVFLYACSKGNLPLVKIFLKAGASIHGAPSRSILGPDSMPLEYAIRGAKNELAQYLVQNGANLEHARSLSIRFKNAEFEKWLQGYDARKEKEVLMGYAKQYRSLAIKNVNQRRI